MEICGCTYNVKEGRRTCDAKRQSELLTKHNTASKPSKACKRAVAPLDAKAVLLTAAKTILNTVLVCLLGNLAIWVAVGLAESAFGP